jgi:hypothetical protein
MITEQQIALIDEYAVAKNYWPHIPYQPVGKEILEEAMLAGIGPYLALGLTEWESGFKLIFGCDQGAPFCHEEVTELKVHWLMGWNAAGGVSQGVGLTQITYKPLILEAHELGGAHLPRYQCQVGFGLLRGYIERFGGDLRRAVGAYNSGPSSPNLEYADNVLELRDSWRRRLRWA